MEDLRVDLWLKWDGKTPIIPLTMGGLGIRPLRLQNQSNLWYGIISTSLSLNSWRDLSTIPNVQLQHIWRSIRKVCMKDVLVWNNFLSNVRVKVHIDLLTSFWDDCWLGDNLFFVVYPNLFCLALRKKEKVVVWLPFLQNWEAIFRDVSGFWRRVFELLNRESFGFWFRMWKGIF